VKASAARATGPNAAPAAPAAPDETRGRAPGGVAVRLEGVTKRFGAFEAVSKLDLAIADGEFFSMLGPSGCGKTTTLRMIAGFEQPSEGRILLEGEPVERVPPYRRNVNTVFQSYALFEHLDVRRNVAFGLRRKKVSGEEIDRRVAEALALVELTGREKAKPAELSGGQKQRVALARALVCRPAVLLLDEPLGALDLKLRKQMQVELKAIQREVGITFVYVTHDQEEALALSDRIAVMDGGVVRQCGTPEEVYERPTESFVAGFIGTSNLMDGVVEDGEVRLASGQRCAAPLPEDAKPGEHVHLSVRPEKIWLDEHEDGMVTLQGTVCERVYVGTTTQVIVELAPGARVVALEQNTHRARSDDRWGLGDRVTVAWRPEHALVLRS
jgi:spermidine/putrescine transport system ATP-binding protein